MPRRWVPSLGGKADDQEPPLGWLDGCHGLLSELGRGATCIVYKARNREGECYALKVPLTSSDSQLIREARFLRALDSPFVPRCLGMQGAYLKMELLQGETLAHRLEQRGRLKLPAMCLLVEGLLGGLEAVHALGVVHTDLKPGNIFLAGRKDQVKLMDFGLALREGERRQAEAQGTAVYAAPEQWNEGQPLDRRADLYSLGVVLYEVATGLLPWSADEPTALLALKRQLSLPPLSRFRSDLSPERERLLADLTHPQPEGRPSSVGEVRARWG